MEMVIETTPIAIPIEDYEKKLTALVKILLELEKTWVSQSDNNKDRKPLHPEVA